MDGDGTSGSIDFLTSNSTTVVALYLQFLCFQCFTCMNGTAMVGIQLYMIGAHRATIEIDIARRFNINDFQHLYFFVALLITVQSTKIN